MRISENLQYLKTIVDNLNDIIVLVGVDDDKTFHALYVNPAFVASTGRGDIVGKPLEETITPENYKMLLPRYQQVIKTRETVEWEDDIPVNGVMHRYEVRLVPVLNAVGDCTQIISISRDTVLSE